MHAAQEVNSFEMEIHCELVKVRSHRIGRVATLKRDVSDVNEL